MPAPAWFYPLPKAIPTFHPSALPSRRWGGGGWREEGSSGTIQRGLVMVTQRWPGSALFPPCWEHRCNLGWDFHPPLNHFSIIPCLPRAFRPARTPSCPSIGVFWGCRSWARFGVWVPGRSSPSSSNPGSSPHRGCCGSAPTALLCNGGAGVGEEGEESPPHPLPASRHPGFSPLLGRRKALTPV